MKLITILIALFVHNSYAHDVSCLSSGSIVVTNPGGTVIKYNPSEWMVVRRHKHKAKPVVLPPKEIIKETIRETNNTVVITEHAPKNRLRVIAGLGPTGYKATISPTLINIHTTNGFVAGLGYDRLLTRHLSLGAQALTNGTFLLGVGLDF